jgi:predicted bacteriocin transport accessory protein
MNENKKIIIVGIIVAVIALIIPIVSYVNMKKTEIVMEKFTTAYEKTEKNMIYIGRDTCDYCKIFTPQLEDLDKIYDIDYIYINTDDITQSQLDKIFEKLGIDASDFGTPYLAIVQDEKVIEDKQGYMSEDSLFEFLQKNEIIAETEKLPLNYIDYEEYKTLLNTKEPEIIVFGQVGCGACESVRPILYEIAIENNVKINYFNLSYLTEDQNEEFGTSLGFLNETEWGTPLMVAVENKEVIDNVNGASDKDFYIDFLKDNGFIE